MASAPATTTATAYKVEELLALRDSVSESAVSIERFADEDAIKATISIARSLRFHPHMSPPFARSLHSPSIVLTRVNDLSVFALPSSIASRPMHDSFKKGASLTKGNMGNGAPSLILRAATPASPFFTQLSRFPISSYDFLEHVLRPSASTNTIGARKENAGPDSLAPNRSTGQAVNDARSVSMPYKRPSPTPSYKRGRAEKLLKEHGSPPTLRVTAGGRVVPMDMPQLGSPRYSQKVLTGPNASGSASTPHPAQAVLSDYPPQGTTMAFGNQLYQFINGQWMPLVALDEVPQVYMDPPFGYQMAPQPLQPVPHYGQPAPPFRYPQQQMAAPLQPTGPTYPQMSGNNFSIPALANENLASQIRDLEAKYAKKDQEHKNLLKGEVLQQDHLDSAKRELIVQTKRSYVTELDQIRKSIKALKETQARAAAGIVDPNIGGHARVEQPLFPSLPPRRDSMLPQACLPASGFPSVAGSSVPQMTNGFDASNVAKGIGAQSQAPFGFQLQNAAAAFQPMPASSGFDQTNGGFPQSLQGSGTISRSPKGRSHAIQIKAPNGPAKPERSMRSSLDPTSPNYEPPKSLSPDVSSPGIFVPPSPSPVASPPANKALLEKQPWLFSHHSETPGQAPADTRSNHKPSISSVSTTDFFPNNPYDHSARKFTEGQTSSDERRTSSSTCPTVETSAANGHPVTPEKGYGDAPWNQEGGSKSQEKFNLVAPPVSPADTRSPSYGNGMEARVHRPAQSYRPELHHFGISADTVPSSNLSIAGSVFTPTGENGAGGQRFGPKGFLDFADKSSAFLDGFSAGLNSRPIASESHPDVLHGYLEGLQKRKSGVLSPQEAAGRPVQSRQASLLNVNDPAFYQPDPTRFPLHTFIDARHRAPTGPVSIATLGLNIHPMALSRSPTPSGVSINGLFPGVADPVQPTVSATTYQPLLSRQQSSASVQLEQVASLNSQQGNRGAKASKSIPCMPFTRAYSGNQMQTQGSGRNGNSFSRQYQGKRTYGQHSDGNCGPYVAPSSHGPIGRPSQYDGAMDDLAEMMMPVRLSPRHDNPSAPASAGSPKKSPKKRQLGSPIKSLELLARMTKDSPTMTKSAEGSETDRKMRRENGEETLEVDPARLRGAEKKSWRENWRKRFQEIKSKEREEIEQYRRENPLDN